MPTRLTDEEREDRRMSEKTLNARVLYRAKKHGWRVVRIQRSTVGPQGLTHRTGTVKGFPDLMLFRSRSRRPGGVPWSDAPGIIYRELKKELGHLDDAQAEWRDLIITAGGDHDVWRPSDLRLGHIERELL